VAHGTVYTRVIREPHDKTKRVVLVVGKSPVLSGGGDLTYVCGHCGNVFLRDVAAAEFGLPSNILMVFFCQGCSCWSEV
jgi:hypothetical protein